MLRNLGALLAGMIVGMAVNMAVLTVSWAIWPMPEGLDLADTAAFDAYVATLPVAALLFVVAAHLGQAFVGGLVAARLAGSRPRVLAMIVGVLSLAGGVANMLQITHPAWMWIELPLYLVVAWGAGTIEVRRRASAPPPTG